MIATFRVGIAWLHLKFVLQARLQPSRRKPPAPVGRVVFSTPLVASNPTASSAYSYGTRLYPPLCIVQVTPPMGHSCRLYSYCSARLLP